MYEVRFHGRGGQGAVTAANILAAAAFNEGKDVQAFPMFGVERRGAPVAAFLRMDEKPIDIKTQIYEPDAVVVLDPSLIDVVNVTEGLKKNGFVIINSTKKPSEFKFGDAKIFTVDATTIAVKNHLGTETSPIVNTAILGAYSKAVGNVGMDAIDKAINENAPIKKEENKNVGIVGTQILNDKNEISRNCARFPTPISMISRSLAIDKLIPKIFPAHFMSEWDHRESRFVDQVMGSFFLIRKKLFEDLNGYDERFFVYYEDVDLALRARGKNYLSYYLSHAQIYHKGGGITEKVKATRLFFNLRSKILFAQKHFSLISFIIVFLVVIILEPITRIVGAVLTGSFNKLGEIVKAYKDLYKSIFFNKILKKSI